MPKETLWEAISHHLGAAGDGTVQLSAVMNDVAVTPEIARIELKQMSEEGLIVWDGAENISLTDRGRLSMSDLNIGLNTSTERHLT